MGVVRILVVDPAGAQDARLRACLAQPGRHLEVVASAVEALRRLCDEYFAFVLADAESLDMDCLAFAGLLRQQPETADLPLVLLAPAGWDGPRTVQAYRSGATEVLHQPVDPDILACKADVLVALYHERRRLDELAQALRMNEIFAAVLSHDLRNPLTAVATGAELLLRNQDPQLVMQTAERIRVSGQRMASMVERLLDAARLRAGTLKTRFERVDLGAIARHIVDEFSGPEHAGRIVLYTHGAVDLVGDAGALGQVLSNLMGNALKHGEKGQDVVVEVDGTAPDAVRVAVKNAGCMQAGLGARAFRPFVRGSTGQGVGLGLYIVSQLVTLHGGRVELRSAQEIGTVVSVTLPRAGGVSESSDAGFGAG